MYEYWVETYIMDHNLLGKTNFVKENKELQDYLNYKDSQGWEVLSITNLNTGGKEFSFEIIYRRPLKKQFSFDDIFCYTFSIIMKIYIIIFKKKKKSS